jgi:cytochrome c oxidase assembly factor CtaG
LALAPVASPAVAHVAGAVDDPFAWTLDAWIVAPLVLAAILYAIGYARWRRRARRGRGRAWLFASGLGILALALLSPLHALGARSFAAHMAEHELMMLVAAPLLVLARPLRTWLWAWPRRWRRVLGGLGRQRQVAGAWGFLTAPLPATVLQAAALWIWHAPGPFQLALSGEGWHALQHACFLATALLFWTAVLDERILRHRPVLAVGCLFTTSLVSGALGALMALSRSSWYAAYAVLGLTPFGLTPAEDQQLAGLLMWIPGGLVHAAAALVLVVQLVRDSPPTVQVTEKGKARQPIESGEDAPPHGIGL